MQHTVKLVRAIVYNGRMLPAESSITVDDDTLRSFDAAGVLYTEVRQPAVVQK